MDKGELQEDSLDTLESTEINLMFQHENGNSDFAEAYRGRRVCLFTTRFNLGADVNGFC